MIRKIFSIPGLIVLTLILIIAYLGFWAYLRSTVVTGVTNYISELESEGYRVEHGGLSIDGFPFSINAQTPNLAVNTTPNTPSSVSGLWSFQTNKVDMFTPTLTPLSWSIRHNGTLRVNSAPSSFDVTPAEIDANIAYDFSGRLKSFHAELAKTQIVRRNGDEPGILGLSHAKADIKVNGETAHVEIHADNVVMSPPMLGDAMAIFGQTLKTVSLNSKIENWQVLEYEGLNAWLQSPAKIKSENWVFQWGNLDLIGRYDLGFKNGLPEGVIGFRVKNVDALMQSLTELGMVDSSFSTQIKAVVDGMPSEDDGRKLIEITIRDGVVKYGFFTLYQF